jgi:hypothetical protein
MRLQITNYKLSITHPAPVTFGSSLSLAAVASASRQLY